MTEREVFEYKLGRKVTDDEIVAMTPRRDKATILATLSRDLVYKLCDVCAIPFCVNNWDDRKARTPRFKGFVVCSNCDPRAVPDRYMKEGYRVIWPGRLRVIRYAQITRAMSIYGCINMEGPEGEGWSPTNCKCAGCAAQKFFPQHAGQRNW